MANSLKYKYRIHIFKRMQKCVNVFIIVFFSFFPAGNSEQLEVMFGNNVTEHFTKAMEKSDTTRFRVYEVGANIQAMEKSDTTWFRVYEVGVNIQAMEKSDTTQFRVYEVGANIQTMEKSDTTRFRVYDIPYSF